MESTPHNQPQAADIRRRSAFLFLLCAGWIFFSLLLAHRASNEVPALWADLFRQGATAALLFAGFHLIASRGVHDLRPLSSVGFVRRPGIAQEFGRGAALGWGIGLALILPAVMTGWLRLSFDFSQATLLRAAISLATLIAFVLATQMIVSGLPVRLLVRAVGSTAATVAVLFLVFVTTVLSRQGEGSSALFAAVAVALFCAAFLRTRALWFSLGVQLAWTITLAMLFGAPSVYLPVTSSVIRADIGGSTALTGSIFGPEASFFALPVLLVALMVLYRLTRDYAWHYTWQPIEGAGHAVVIAPPAEHVLEEQRAAAAAPSLVQIAPAVTAEPTDTL